MFNSRSKTFMVAMIFGASVGSTNLLAESIPALETVVVSAQQRQEDLQNLSISTRVLTPDLIESQDIKDIAAVAQHVPNVSYAEFAPGQSLVAIRGIISADDGPGMDNSIAVFVDDLYMGRQALVNIDLIDLESIEVLKGPQGTIFGRNAIGGAINIRTRQPGSREGLKISAGVGNFSATRFNSLFEKNLGEQLSTNLSVSHRRREGFTRNVLLDVDNQDEDSLSLRNQWRIENETLDLLLSLQHVSDQRGDMGRTPIVNNGAFDYVSLWKTLGGQPFRSTSPIDGFSDRKLNSASIRSVFHLENSSLTLIAGLRQGTTDWEMASIGAPFNGAYDLDAGVFGIDVNDDIAEDIRQKQIELRWATTLSENVNVSLGTFALEENTERVEQFKLQRNTLATGQITLGNEVSDQRNTTQALAIYGHAQWDMGEQWQLEFGARVSQDKKDIDTISLNCGDQDINFVANSTYCNSESGSLNIIQTSFQTNATETWLDISPKLALEYHPSPNAMLYGSIAKGFKSGGFGGAPGLQEIAQQSVAPEEVWNYEVGSKYESATGRMRANVSLFYMDYQNLQVVHFGPSQSNPGFGSFTTQNIDSSTITGLEFDASLVLSSSFTLHAHLAALETEVKNFELDTAAGLVDLSGSDLRQAPPKSAAITLQHSFSPRNDRGLIKTQLHYLYKDEQLSDYINQKTLIDTLSLVNLDTTWTLPSENFEIALWVKNLSDKHYISHSYTIGPGVIGIWGPPRTFGVTLRWNAEI